MPNKSASHAYRGKPLEHAVRELFKHYRLRSIPCHFNQPRILQDGTPAEKNDFDCEVFHAGRFYAFDCKMVDGAVFRPDKRFLHQEKALTDVSAQGGEGFFLVLFTPIRTLVRFDCPLPADKPALRPEDGRVLKGLDFLGILTPT